MHQLVIKGFN